MLLAGALALALTRESTETAREREQSAVEATGLLTGRGHDVTSVKCDPDTCEAIADGEVMLLVVHEDDGHHYGTVPYPAPQQREEPALRGEPAPSRPARGREPSRARRGPESARAASTPQ